VDDDDRKGAGLHKPDEFAPAFGLYREALAQVRAAERFHDSERPDARLRESDAAAAAIILTQASLESWVKTVCNGADIDTSRVNWIQCWRDSLPDAVCAPGADPDVKSGPQRWAILDMLNDLRNYLAHGDKKARDKVRRALPDVMPLDVLTKDVAFLFVYEANIWFEYGMALTGLLAPTRSLLLEMSPGLLD